MIVDCTQNKIVDSGMINSNMSQFIEIGDRFKVYGIGTNKTGVYYLIFVQNRHLVEVPSNLFEITDNQIDPNWCVTIDSENCNIRHEIFNQPFFFDNFSDDAEYERNLFEQIR